MTTPRPHPRFAGAEVLIIHGANMVQEGASRKNVGLIVGGVILVVIGLALMALGYYYRDVLSAWLGRATAAIRAAGDDGAAHLKQGRRGGPLVPAGGQVLDRAQ